MQLVLLAVALLVVCTWSDALRAQGPGHEWTEQPKGAAPCSAFFGKPIAKKVVIATCTQLIESGKLTGRALARAYLTRLLSKAGSKTDPAQVIAEATVIIENDQQEILGYLFRLGGYQEVGDFERAIQDADKYIGLVPNDPNALNIRSSVYAAKGDFERALADNTKAIEMAPQNPTLYGLRAWTYAKAGRTAEALSDLNQGLSLPNRHLWPISHLYHQRAKLFEGQGRAEEAIADYREALRLQSGMTFVEANNAEIREALKRLGATP